MRGVYYNAKMRDIAFVRSDLATASDLEWIEQRLYLRILTEKGELLDYPDFGTLLWQMVSKGTRPSNLQAMERELIETLMQDPDVTEVRDVTVRIDNDTVSISAVAVTVIGDIDLNASEVLV
ncbi:DUF2634 domain-containing protein [Brevibacillus sp. AG]|uniref:DUF2634 domain-containing protein n=1 Tax=Brevibacillus sp. AG TaxID=3020891 RepID=UPI00232E7118|nr:DUF2634 domain-containing protein [Brevibacillus sp. AG]MDC0763491.1 DUF2634 domain-containing protein [Brevibacillus sp. AG]